MASAYVHGYDRKEAQRLQDQATTLVDLLHMDTAFPAGSTVLEAGCGVGAQTVAIAARSPGAHITSIDLSEVSLQAARKAVEANGLSNVRLLQGDIMHLEFAPDSFDHVFICFVLEHLPQPMAALDALKRVRDEVVETKFKTGDSAAPLPSRGGPAAAPNPKAKFEARGVEGDITQVVGGATNRPIPSAPKMRAPAEEQFGV